MANAYTPTYLTNGDKGLNTKQAANETILIESFEVAADDGNGDTFVVGIISGNDRPSDIRVFNDAITAGTDYDLGVYLWDAESRTLGAAVDADLFADGLNLSSATDATFALSAPDIANIGKTVHELLEAASITTNANEDQYALVWTGNTVGSAAGTITTIYKAIRQS